jgi:hypothetical protein
MTEPHAHQDRIEAARTSQSSSGGVIAAVVVAVLLGLIIVVLLGAGMLAWYAGLVGPGRDAVARRMRSVGSVVSSRVVVESS